MERLHLKPEWLMAAIVMVGTTALTLLTIRWIAPQLLGVPVDLQLVQSSKMLPPFFDGVFRAEDYASHEFLLKDPVTNVRAKPLMEAANGTGPHDLLGFRNTDIPDHPDVIAIGDSQTYGIGEPIDSNWPSQLAGMLKDEHAVVYNMAVGGWAAPQYLHMASMAVKFRPRMLIVAYYTGNDPLESFVSVYGNSHWSELMPDPRLDKSDAPTVGNILDVESSWPAKFRDGGKIRFTPVPRLAANDNQPAAQAGYAIMAESARRIDALAREHGIAVVFTVIPTRELVYAQKVSKEGLSPPESYRQLVEMESKNIDRLASVIQSIPDAHYVDLVIPLQSAAFGKKILYPRMWDGHPGVAGYHVIASALATVVSETLAR